MLQVISRSTFDSSRCSKRSSNGRAGSCEADSGTIHQAKDGVYYRAALYGFPPDLAEWMSSPPGRAARERP